MYPLRVTVAVPTIGANEVLWECIEGLHRQTFTGFRIVIVDNSGENRVRHNWPPHLPAAEVLAPGKNLGYGGAINHAVREFPAEYVAVINDDAVASPEWLAAMVDALEKNPRAGSVAAQVRLYGSPGMLDSAGMCIAADGTARQRGHRQPVSAFPASGRVLMPSGSASLYRFSLLEQLNGFDESYFLYCEDTDLGLRALWNGWTCLYVAEAVVDHRYSHSAGRASPLKAYLVERNRLFTIVKNLPLPELIAAGPASIARYLHHWLAMRQGRGAAAEFRKQAGSPWRLVLFVLRAHLAAIAAFPKLWRQRRAIFRNRRIDSRTFRQTLRRYSISLREVASL